MSNRVTGWWVVIGMAACPQQPGQAEDDRVRAIVETLVGTTHVPGMPGQFVDQRRLVAEARVVADINEGRDDDLEEEAPSVVPLGRVALAPESFDNWVFGNMAAKDVRAAWIESVLKQRLIVQGVRHRLTAPQLAKLHLAGRGDVKRLFDSIEARRGEFEATRHDFAKTGPVFRTLNPLGRQFMNGPFDDGSLFLKTLEKILRDREAETRKRRAE